jgi:acyl-coenzyme A synthetase/AMP-(fatty) acid ligase
LPDFKRLSRYLVWDEDFPRTASMKIKRGTLAERIAQKLDREALKEI